MVKRYEYTTSDEMAEDPNGEFVKHEDYVILRSALQALYVATECDVADAGAYDADVESAIMRARELLAE